MLKNFTLYVPVRDRQYNLVKIASYYNDLDCKKIVFDSSVRKYDKIDMLEKSGFDYVYFGPMSFWEKCKKIHDYIDTEYALDNPDDDITIKSSIKKCLEFLEGNKDYVCCFGELYEFKDRKMAPLCPNKHQGGLALDFRSESPFERIYCAITKCTIGINHAVFKSEILKNFYNFILDNKDIQAVNFVERFLIIFAMTYGNLKILPILYQMRNKANDHVFKKYPKDMMITTALQNSLDEKHLMPLSKVLALYTNESEQKCFEFIREKLSEHFKYKEKFGLDWCQADLSPIERNYDKEIDDFTKNYLNL